MSSFRSITDAPASNIALLLLKRRPLQLNTTRRFNRRSCAPPRADYGGGNLTEIGEAGPAAVAHPAFGRNRVSHGPRGCGHSLTRMGSLSRTPVPLDLNASLAVFERHLQNLIGQVPVGVEFIQHFGEQFSLEREVHAGGRIKTDQPRME